MTFQGNIFHINKRRFKWLTAFIVMALPRSAVAKEMFAEGTDELFELDISQLLDVKIVVVSVAAQGRRVLDKNEESRHKNQRMLLAALNLNKPVVVTQNDIRDKGHQNLADLLFSLGLSNFHSSLNSNRFRNLRSVPATVNVSSQILYRTRTGDIAFQSIAGKAFKILHNNSALYVSEDASLPSIQDLLLIYVDRVEISEGVINIIDNDTERGFWEHQRPANNGSFDGPFQLY